MRFAVILAIFSTFSISAHAEKSAFTMGPVFEKFGPVADVDADFEIPEGTQLRVSFDVAKGADQGDLNKTLVTAARFINMHVRAGVPLEDIDVAVAVHGKAILDVTKASKYDEEIGGENANAELVSALTKKGVRIIVCGQSSASQGIKKADLLPGVEVAVSALTVHAVLLRNGYTLNPF